MTYDLPSVFVGIVGTIAMTFGVGYCWYVYGASPRERAERRRAKWKEQAERKSWSGNAEGRIRKTDVRSTGFDRVVGGENPL